MTTERNTKKILEIMVLPVTQDGIVSGIILFTKSYLWIKISLLSQIFVNLLTHMYVLGLSPWVNNFSEAVMKYSFAVWSSLVLFALCGV